MKKLLVIVIILLVLFLVNDFQSITIGLSPENIRNSIRKAIDFLYERQMENGKFDTLVCMDAEMKNCYHESSPFITASILYSLKDIEGEKARYISGRGTNFLFSTQESNGMWKFWAPDNPTFSSRDLNPDIDDTSLVSFILKIYNKTFEDNYKLVGGNKDENGLFFTWIGGRTEMVKALSDNENSNDIDCGVNANVLLYLDENDPVVCSYINNAIMSSRNCSSYYTKKLVLYYIFSRAFVNNITCLEESKDIIVRSILRLQNDFDSFDNDLDTSLALSALMNFDYYEDGVGRGIKILLQRQTQEGSWKIGHFFTGSSIRKSYYGSKELTTALAVEALNKYLDRISQQKRNEID